MICWCLGDHFGDILVSLRGLGTCLVFWGVFGGPEVPKQGTGDMLTIAVGVHFGSLFDQQLVFSTLFLLNSFMDCFIDF